MKAFVTGACGFIGSHLAEALVKEGHDVTAMAIISARDTFGWLDEIDIRKVRGDVRDAEQMRSLIKGHDIVFHLAALGSVPYSYEAPRSFIDTNVTGTLNVLEACKATGAKLVHTSTSEVYGTALYTPQDEKHPLQAQSPYAASKIAADKFVEAYHRTYEMSCVTVRPFNCYGPRQSERAVIPSIIRQAFDPSCKEIKVGNLKTRRDFSYVSDTVAAFIKVMSYDGVWNHGYGTSDTIQTIVDAIKFTYDVTKPVVSDPDRLRPETSEVFDLVSGGKLHARLGLAEGLTKTVAWWRTREFRPDVGMVA